MPQRKRTKKTSSADFWTHPLFPFVLYAFLSFVAFFPCLVLGQAYFDNDLLAQFGPWRSFLRDQLSQGHFPLWNPYSLGGQPFFADLQNMMLYPINYLTLPFSVPYGMSVFFFLHMFIAAAGMHLWLRSLRLSENACVAGSLLFGLSNFFWLEIIHPPVVAAFAWLPWLFVRLELLALNPKPRNAFYAGFCFAMLFLCGSFQVTVGAFYGGLAYFLFRVWNKIIPTLKKGGKGGFRSLAFCSFLFLWGALPLLGQLIPTLEFSKLTDRGAPHQTYEQANSRLPLNPLTLYQLFLPRFDLTGKEPMAEVVQSKSTDDKMPLAGNWGYLGIWAPFLALAAFRRKEKGMVKFLSAFALIALVLCFGKYTPLHHLLCGALPGISLIRVPYRFLYLFILPLCLLAAFGFEEWFSKKPVKGKVLDQLRNPLIYAIVIYAVGLFRPALNWREILASILGLAAFFTISKGKKHAPLLMQTALALPLLLNGWADFMPGPSSNFDYEKNSKTLVEIGQRVKPFRLQFDNIHMYYPIEVQGQKYLLNYPQNAACALKIKNIGGYNPLILQSKMDMGTQGLESMVGISALKGIVTQQDHGSIPGFKLESFPPFLLYENQKSVSYINAPNALLMTGNDLDWLQKPDFDSSQTAIFSEALPVEWTNGLGKTKPFQGVLRAWSYPESCHFQYQLSVDEPDAQSFEVTLDQNRVLVFPETNFPGWKAWTDGQSTPILTADHFLRSIYLPAGKHQVEFRFEPDWYQPLNALLAIWMLSLIGFVFWRQKFQKGKELV